MLRIVVLVVLSLISVGTDAAAVEVGQTVRVTLDDGTIVHGVLVTDSGDSIGLESPTLGTLNIPRSTIRTMISAADSSRETDPDLNSLMFVPTSETLEKGDHYYRNFEVLFNNLGIAVTDDVSISLMAVFPVDGDFLVGSVGAKARLLSRETSPVGVAVAGGVLVVNDESVVSSASLIASIGDRYRSLSAAGNLSCASGECVFYFLVGGDVQVGRRTKLLAEYGNVNDSLLGDTDFRGLANLGFRVFWSGGSFSLTGLSPLDSSLFAFPMAQVSLHF